MKKIPKIPKNLKPPKNDDSNIVRSKTINAIPIILKVADEIVRMENNLNFMDEDIKGKKQCLLILFLFLSYNLRDIMKEI